MTVNLFSHRSVPIARNSGFSLVELVIVMVIIAVLGAVAMPNLSPANARLKQAARELYGNLQRARMEAIKTNQDVGVIFDTANNQYLLCQNANSDNDCSDAGETILSTTSLTTYGSSVQYGCGAATRDATTSGGACPASGVSYSPTNVRFTPRGTLSGTSGYVYLQNDKQTSYVLGTPTSAGVIVMKKWVNGSWQ